MQEPQIALHLNEENKIRLNFRLATIEETNVHQAALLGR
jgi:hypothetical protein